MPAPVAKAVRSMDDNVNAGPHHGNVARAVEEHRGKMVGHPSTGTMPTGSKQG